MEMKKHGGRKVEELASTEQRLFYRKQCGSKDLHERWTNGWRQRCPNVQEYKKRRDKKSGCAAQERHDDTQPASGMKEVKT